jgi:cell division protein FtsZ
MYYTQSEAMKKMLAILPAEGKTNDIHIDIDDIKTIVQNGDRYMVLEKKLKTDDASLKAIKNSLKSLPFKNIAGVLVNFELNSNFDIGYIKIFMNIIEEVANEDADIIFGTTTNTSLDEKYLNATILLTGSKE